MKLIIAIIQPETLEAVEAALNDQDVHVLSVSQVVKLGPESTTTETYRGQQVRRRRPKLRVEIAAGNGMAEAAVDAIARAVATVGAGPAGDGNVFVLDLDKCFGVRNGGRDFVAVGI